MSAPLSNFLSDLADRARVAMTASDAAHMSAIAKALEAGEILCDARDICAHGNWASFLTQAGIHERQARRLMQLARSGLVADTVSELGGVKAALEWLKGRVLPEQGQVLFVEIEGRQDRVGLVWPSKVRGHFEMARVDCGSRGAQTTRLCKPASANEPLIWEVLTHILAHRPADLRFSIVSDEAPTWEAVLADIAADGQQ